MVVVVVRALGALDLLDGRKCLLGAREVAGLQRGLERLEVLAHL